MKFKIILLFALAGTLFSCREEEEMVIIPEDEELDLSTAFTYTVDGIMYEGTSMPGWGFGNPHINQMNGKPHNDTMWVHTQAKLTGTFNNELKIISGKNLLSRI